MWPFNSKPEGGKQPKDTDRLRVARWVFQFSAIPLFALLLAWIGAPFADAFLMAQIGEGAAASAPAIRPDVSEIGAIQLSVENTATALLPLFAGWIGSVIAYYFVTSAQRDAADQAARLVRPIPFTEQLQAKSLRSVMAMELYGVELGNQPTPLESIEAVLRGELQTPARTRCIIFERKGRKRIVRTVIHASTFYAFLAARGGVASMGTLSVEDLLEDADTRERIAGGTRWMSPEDSLADVHALMKRVPHVQDIIITQRGREDGEVFGYLTNGDVLRHCLGSAETGNEA
jgi:hypothetical protein